MIVKNAELVAVTAKKNQYPPDTMMEVAFAGRSNVGKSSLLNLLTGRRKLARISGAPGKTRTINFYEINGKFRIVDLPGYGYARVSKSISETWGNMVETYLENRNGLVKVIQLVDIRHEPTAQDVQMYSYLKHFGLDGPVVATKLDKISRNEMYRNLERIRKKLDMSPEERLIPVSALKNTGYGELLEAIENLISYDKM